MLYLSSIRPDHRLFFYHVPTATLAELLLNAGPGGNHVLRVASDSPPPDDAFSAIAGHLRHAHPDAADHLTIFSRAALAASLPPSILLVHATEKAMLIHYPALGFTAGVRGDGSKIPPTWKDPSRFTPEQRSHLIAQAKDDLNRSIAGSRQAG